MNEIRRNWFGRTGIMALVAAGLIGLGACSGGGSDGLTQAQEEALQAELDAAEEARRRAEAAQAEAERQQREAEARRQQAETDRQAAEAERQRLEEEAEERRKADAAAATRRAIVGLNAGSTLTLGVGTIRYGAPGPLTTPTGPFTTTTGRSGQWSTTTHSASTGQMRDFVELYSDVEAPTSVPFKDSVYNPGDAVVNAEGMVLSAGFDLGTANRPDVASGSFDRTSAPPKSFDMMDRGFDDQAAKDTAITNCAADTACEARVRGIPVRNTDRHPYRWTAEAGGTLGGASGTFRCGEAASTADTSCTVQNTGGGFVFAGPWRFVPSSGTVGVRVNDSEYMWFGWWARQTVEHEEGTPADVHPTDDWAFGVGHGGNAVTTFAGATGPATYQGPAAGRYAVFEPATGESSHGSFTASATLNANFGNATDEGTISGTITGFSNDPDWSLALKEGTIGSGVVAVETDGVTWTINGVPDDSGQWEADFYSNLPTDTAGLAQVQPHGVAGTFAAQYDGSGVGPTAAMIGAFGAHRPQ